MNNMPIYRKIMPSDFVRWIAAGSATDDPDEIGFVVEAVEPGKHGAYGRCVRVMWPTGGLMLHADMHLGLVAVHE